MVTPVIIAGFEHGTIAGNAVGNQDNRVFTGVTGATIVTTSPRTGTYCLEVTGAASGARNVFWGQSIIGAGGTAFVGSFYFKVGAHASGGNDAVGIFPVAGSGGFIFTDSDQRIYAGIASGDGDQQGPVLTADQWYLIDFRFDVSTGTTRLDWSVDGVAQTQATKSQSASTIDEVYLGRTSGSATFTYRYDDFVGSLTAADYPIGPHKVMPLGVDTGGTLTVNGATTNFNTFTSNGTLAAWNATTARNNIDERPPTIGGTADGLVQVTTSTTGYVQIPMTTYTLGAGESILGVRVQVCGWATTTQAATIGLRAFNGATEETLQAGTVDPQFDNSTTAPAWLCRMLTQANYDTQTELDGLALRVGFSSDAAPDIGIHAAYAEVAVLEAAGEPPAEGSAAVGLDVALSATGEAPHEGTAAVGLTLAVATSGAVDHEGTAGLGVDLAVAAAGETAAEGSADVGLALALAATGDEPPNEGSAALGLALEVSAIGEAESAGAADLDLDLAAAAAGEAEAAGTTDLGLVLAVETEGATDATGAAGLGVQLTLDGSGGRDSGGSAGVDVVLDPAATGETSAGGGAGLGLAIDLAAAGEAAAEGSTDLGLDLALAATGQAPGVGIADGVAHLGLALDLAATGEVEAAGSTGIGVSLNITASGEAPAEATVDIDVDLDISATGEAPGENTAEGTAAFVIELAAATSGQKPAALGAANLGVTLDVQANGMDTSPSPPEEVDLMTAAFVIVTGVGQCIVDELESTEAGVPDRVCLAVPGTIAWDSCDCGQLAQTITADTPSNAFPAPAVDVRASPCGPPLLVVSVVASVVRCVPTLTDSGKPPTCDALFRAALTIEQDREALRKAVVCCLLAMRRAYRITDFALGTTTTVGEQGGCAGVEMTYQFGVSNVCCG